MGWRQRQAKQRPVDTREKKAKTGAGGAEAVAVAETPQSKELRKRKPTSNVIKYEKTTNTDADVQS